MKWSLDGATLAASSVDWVSVRIAAISDGQEVGAAGREDKARES
jgi:hypothetical protein